MTGDYTIGQALKQDLRSFYFFYLSDQDSKKNSGNIWSLKIMSPLFFIIVIRVLIFGQRLRQIQINKSKYHVG